ncbi:hypothetical protein [Parasaccharibacter sp. TMW2.1890]|uniref:hypothetical protein n=1 Tax=Parasaccharibacter sp. TMW2.1890 TaxID=2039289 RepID=UPI002012067F|nr:hypothetical protein [Parasaccharibacter sp. TMW2.1890]MCL1515237.1 hypothetical protein [Parasaccharibacter sp. TMW2.1890]
MNDNTPGINPVSLSLHERVAALEAVQERHDEDLTKLSNKIDNLAVEFRAGIAALSNQIRDTNSSRSRIVTAAISGGAAIGGGVAVGLYQIIHTLYPHFFGG